MTDDVLGKALYGAVDEDLTILGRSARMILSGSVSKLSDSSSYRVEVVSETLEVLLGQCGKLLQRLIAKHLYRKLDFDFQVREKWALTEYVEDAKRKLETCSSHSQSKVVDYNYRIK
jgi:hypothetical protein